MKFLGGTQSLPKFHWLPYHSHLPIVFCWQCQQFCVFPPNLLRLVVPHYPPAQKLSDRNSLKEVSPYMWLNLALGRTTIGVHQNYHQSPTMVGNYCSPLWRPIIHFKSREISMLSYEYFGLEKVPFITHHCFLENVCWMLSSVSPSW